MSLFRYLMIIFSLSNIAFSAWNEDVQLVDSDYGTGKPVFKCLTHKHFSRDDNIFYFDSYIKIANNRLHFIKEDSLFTARYKINVAIFDNNNKEIPVFQKKNKKTVSTLYYEETDNPKIFDISKYRFKLTSGSYTLKVVLEDLLSENSFSFNEDFSFEDKGDYAVSFPLLINGYIKETDFVNENFNPVVDNVIYPENKEMTILFNIFGRNSINNYKVRYVVISKEGDYVYEKEYQKYSNKQVESEFLNIELKNIKIGNFKLKIYVELGGKTFQRSLMLHLRSKDVSVELGDLDQSLLKMKYLINRDTITSVLSLRYERKKIWFENFWNKMGRELNVSASSISNVYFRRSNYCDLHFSSTSKNGWLSDRGEVYMVMGRPDEIQNYQFPKKGNPYIVWVYYSKQVQYIFEYKYGKYQLKNGPN